MKRILALILASTMILVAFTGCGKNKTAEKGAAGGAVNTDIKGTITVGINSYRNSDFEAICEAFKKQYPNVEVKPILFEANQDDAVEYLTSLIKDADKIVDEFLEFSQQTYS